MYWADGTVYKGQWEQGVHHGPGVLHLPNGEVKEGLFENNVYIGKVVDKKGKPAEGEQEAKPLDLDKVVEDQ